MNNQKIRLLHVFNPATDIPAYIMIMVGLGIALFLGDVAVRLIGVCIALLGGVAVFVLLSQRLKDIAALSAKKQTSASEVTTFKTTVKQEQSGKRLVFDDFAESFGTSDFEQATAPGKDIIPPAEPREASYDQPVEPRPTQTARIVFDDTGNNEGFSFKDGTPNLTLNPDAYQPLERNAPVLASPYLEEIVSEPESHSAPVRFDGMDDTAGVTWNTTVNFVVPMEQSAVSPIVNQQPPEGAPVRPPLTNEAYTPIPTPDIPDILVGAENEEIRVVGRKKIEHESPEPENPPKQPMEQGELAVIPDEPHNIAKVPTPIPVQPVEPYTHPYPDIPLEESIRSATKRKKLSVERAELEDTIPDYIQRDPRKEFDYLLNRVLLVIRSVISARTAAFLWVHADQQECIMEARISDVEDALQESATLPIKTDDDKQDIISQIALTGVPEILTEIHPNSELQLLPYYTTTAQTRSFIGVPVFFNNVVVGILLADSPADDAYDSLTVSFLGHFTKLISGLIQGYNEKFDLLQSARLLEALETFRTLTDKYDPAPEDISEALVESVSRLIPHHSLGVIHFSAQRGQWYVSALRSKEAFDITGGEVFLDNSLAGTVIQTGKTVQTEHTAGKIRVTPLEAKRNTITFTAVPLISALRCYGALFVEEISSTRLNRQDLELLQTTAQYAGSALEQIQLKDFFQHHTVMDDTTEVFNKHGFLQRAQEEFTRASDVQLAFSVALIGIDHYSTFSHQNQAQFTEAVLVHIVQMVRKNLRVYDVIGRYSDTVLAVGLVEKNTQDSQLWAERVRREIAGSALNIEGKQYAVTVSIGVAEYVKQKSLAEVMGNAETSFAIAREKTNVVSLFS